ncbi:hypothetical protein, partial [uncultured Parasutterella sp.]|uniref:hypothetical protein n=2 Tax=uncultured Parasutterella sp. TaxID=1263098 RepID=UPI00272C435B
LRSTKTTKKRQTSKEDAFGLRAEPLLEALDSAIFQEDSRMTFENTRLLPLLIVLEELSVNGDIAVNIEGSISLAIIGVAALLRIIRR